MVDIERLGYSQITFKSDNEPAIVQVLKETLKSFKVGTVDQAMEEHPAPYDSKANGAVENAVKQVQGIARSFKIALGRAIGESNRQDHSSGPSCDLLVNGACGVHLDNQTGQEERSRSTAAPQG